LPDPSRRHRSVAAWVALGVAAATVGLGAGPAATRANAQVSPGPLAAPHADLDQLTKCFACHSRSETMTQRCVACHTEIAWSRAQKRGLHARPEYGACEKCHPDHAGRDFSMITWEDGSAAKFRHDRTGYALTGAHAALRCAQCHAAANQKSAVAPLIKKKNRAASFLGLETACATCHQDPHAGRFGAACAKCHQTTKWAQMNESTFNHDETRYPLRGRHALVACANCHDETRAFGPKPRFDRCDACHRDVHAGAGTLAGKPADCAACHDVGTFTQSTFTAAMHAKSAYPLVGKHRDVACSSCHLRKPAGIAAASLGDAGVWLHPKHEACADCHGSPHGAQLAGNAKALACVSCHDLDAWKPARFTIADHAKSAFALTGAHLNAACRACHDVGRAGLAPFADAARFGKVGFAMTMPERACADCHADPHQGRFAPRSACGDCHTTGAWRPARVGVAEHAKFRFPLAGAHRAVLCVDCHRDLAGRSTPGGGSANAGAAGARSGTAGDDRSTLIRATRPVPPLTFAVAKQACADCHAGPHGDQFTKPAARAMACERCHGVEVFRPATGFDHARDTAFPLDGAHRGVPCARCHGPVKSPNGDRIVRYRGVPTACESCHPVTGEKR
jgi:hypothetical protein